jgi:hypothetical protein
MKRKLIPMILLAILLLWLAACNLPIVIQVQTAPSPADMTAAILTGVAGTMAFQTSVAGTLMAGQPGGGGATSGQTNTPLAPPTLTSTALPTFTMTPSKPMLTVSQNTYCRTGPGSEYDLVTTVVVGDQVEVVAKDPYSSSWYIRNPDNPYGYCWVWGQYATVTGNTDIIPIFTPPPTPPPTFTPTPTADFSVAYKALSTCVQFYVKFSIVNTGSVTWESVETKVTDLVTSVTVTQSKDKFEEWNLCAAGIHQSDLTPGESGEAWGGMFAANPTGHNMQATIKVCSQNALAGTCLSKTINFTP